MRAWTARTPDGLLPALVALAAALVLRAVLADVDDAPRDLSIIWRGYDAFLHGRSPYPPGTITGSTSFVHPPGSPLALGWLGLVSLRTAAIGWGVALAVLVPLAVAAWTRAAGLAPRAAAACVLLVVASFPYRAAVRLGNVDALCLVLLALGLALLARRRARGLVVVLLAAAVVVKPTAGLVVLAPLVVGEVAVGAGALVLAAAVTALGFLVVPDAGRFVSGVLPYLRDVQPGNAVNGALAGLPEALGADVGTSATPLVLLALAAFVAVGVRRRRRLRGDLPATVALLAVAGLLVPTYAFPPYVLYLALALPLLARLRSPPQLALAAVAALLVAGPGIGIDRDGLLGLASDLRLLVGDVLVAGLVVWLLEDP